MARDINFWRQVGSSPECYYNGAQYSSQLTFASYATGTMYTCPFIEVRGGTIDQINIRKSNNGSAGSVARLGIYNVTSSRNLYPGSLLLDAGIVTLDTGGASTRTAIVAQALSANTMYWFVLSHNSSVAMSIVSESDAFPWLGHDANLTTTGSCSHWRVAFVHAALPDPFPVGATFPASTAFPPAIRVRYSA